MNSTQIAIFASGTGTNANEITTYFKKHDVRVSVNLIISDNEDAGVKQFAEKHAIPFVYLPYKKLKDKSHTLGLLKQYNINFIVLAGFMRLLPEYLVQEFRQRIVNIHPALLPKYGGKGMYGHHVHEKVKSNGDQETGITIHLVNEKYDEGDIIFQKSIALDEDDSVEEIEQKVHTLEYKYYPKVIHAWIRDQFSS